MATANTHLPDSSAREKQTVFVSDSLAFGVVFAILLTIIQRAVGFGRGILFCRLMTDQELGQWSMVFSFLMLLAPLAVLGLPGCFGRFTEHYLNKNQLGIFVRRIAFISSGLTALLAFAMYSNPKWISQIVFRSDAYVSIVNSMAFAVILVAAFNFLSSLLESLRQVRLVTVMRFVQGVGFAMFGTLLILQWDDAAAGATFGFGLASCLACIPALWFVIRNRGGFVDSGETLTPSVMWKRIAPFAIWLWASNLVWNMFEVADRYMLVHWADATAEQAHGFVGQYHSGRVIPMLLVGIAVVLEGMLMPYITVLWEQEKRQESGRQVSFALKLIAVGFASSALVIQLFAPWLFHVVLQGKYNDGLAVLPLTFVFSIWFSMFMFGQIYLWVAEKGKLVFAITGSGLILNLVLNALLIPGLGIWGAIGATTSATLFCLLATNIAVAYCGFAFDRRTWFVCLLPLIVLMPTAYAITAMLLLSVFGLLTNQLFSTEEKQLMAHKAGLLLSRLRLR